MGIRSALPARTSIKAAMENPLIMAMVQAAYKREATERALRQKISNFQFYNKGIRKMSFLGSWYHSEETSDEDGESQEANGSSAKADTLQSEEKEDSTAEGSSPTKDGESQPRS